MVGKHLRLAELVFENPSISLRDITYWPKFEARCSSKIVLLKKSVVQEPIEECQTQCRVKWGHRFPIYTCKKFALYDACSC